MCHWHETGLNHWNFNDLSKHLLDLNVIALVLLHSDWPKLNGVLAILSTIGLSTEWGEYSLKNNLKGSVLTTFYCCFFLYKPGGGEAADTLHTLSLLRSILPVLPHNSVKSACETILRVMTLSNVVSSKFFAKYWNTCLCCRTLYLLKHLEIFLQYIGISCLFMH